MARNSLRDAEVWSWLVSGCETRNVVSLLKEDAERSYAITGGDHWFVTRRLCDTSSSCGVGPMRPGVKANSWPQ